ncbi:hypothetical protein NPIL_342301 [Nephila pilipes]|uniref:Uncharacterized protein n=1 Tax=Nephila pilipes TaxID=299642 RepID=A0A8X6QS15_NEPPI|nr:hypothetical protein NPIL_342301 [Nephila pilipes]
MTMTHLRKMVERFETIRILAVQPDPWRKCIKLQQVEKVATAVTDQAIDNMQGWCGTAHQTPGEVCPASTSHRLYVISRAFLMTSPPSPLIYILLISGCGDTGKALCIKNMFPTFLA